MLVKFLSFVASIMGTARYKAIFLSCLAVVLSITGVTAVALFKDGTGSKNAASTAGKQNDDSPKQDGTPQLGDINKQQSTKDVDQTQTNSQNNTNNTPSDNANTPPSDTSTAATEVVLSTDKVTLTAGTNSDSLGASLSDKTSVNWTITPATDSDTGIRAVIAQNSTATLSFQLQASQNLQPGTVIRLNVTAHDPNRNLNLSKQITVTIQ
jgi:hypothetical protein